MNVYIFEYEIDGVRYSGRLTAKSFEHAQSLVPFANRVDKLIKDYLYEGKRIEIVSPNNKNKQ